MSIAKAVEVLETITGAAGDNFMTHLFEWNKSGVYPLSPIHIDVTLDGVKDNSEDVGKIVDVIEAHINDVVANDLDLEVCENNKKTVAEIGKFLVETRKIQTNPLGQVTKNYTKHESKFKEFNEKLNAKIDAIKEKEYQKSEIALTEYLEAYIETEALGEYLNLTMFKDFIENKRKTKFFTSKGELNKAIKDAVEDVVRIAYEPIKKELELNERKKLQLRQFQDYIDNVDSECMTNNLEANIKQLLRFKESVEELYPDIKENCLMSIDNKISRCRSNIRANNAEMEADAIKNADVGLMDRVSVIKEATDDLTAGVYMLNNYHKELQTIYPKLTFSDNQERVKILGTAIKQRIVDMETAELAQVAETKEDVPSDAKTYGITTKILEPLIHMKIVASSEEDAKEQFVERFKAHISMIDLVIK